MTAIYCTFKNCSKKIGSPCFFSPCVPVIEFFFLVSRQMFKTETIVKNSYFIAKTMNLTKTLSPFVCLGFIFQLTNLKLTDLEKKKM